MLSAVTLVTSAVPSAPSNSRLRPRDRRIGPASASALTFTSPSATFTRTPASPGVELGADVADLHPAGGDRQRAGGIVADIEPRAAGQRHAILGAACHGQPAVRRQHHGGTVGQGDGLRRVVRFIDHRRGLEQSRQQHGHQRRGDGAASPALPAGKDGGWRRFRHRWRLRSGAGARVHRAARARRPLRRQGAAVRDALPARRRSAPLRHRRCDGAGSLQARR